jgi:hypothetical protein
MTLQCIDCKKELDASKFYHSSASSTGYRPVCKPCRYIKDRQKKLQSRHRTRARKNPSKKCVVCGVLKGLSCFYKALSNGDGRHRICKNCLGIKRGVGTEDYNKRQRARYKRDYINRLLEGARFRAKRDGLPFDLTPADIHIPAVCPALGIPIIQGRGIHSPHTPTMDNACGTCGAVVGHKQGCASDAIYGN